MWIAHLFFASLFIGLGLLFFRGKGAFLIAGYNTSSKQEKEKTDVKALTRFMGKLMFFLSACILIMATSDLFASMIPLWIGLALFLVGCIGAVIYANTGNRFQK